MNQKKTIKRLTDTIIAKRRDRGKGFAELVAGEKAEFILTLDEAMLPPLYSLLQISANAAQGQLQGGHWLAHRLIT